tara:strand:- start:397 stop:720 length:324 start_codon:yes stop_codon:yes gene_type:complete
MAAGAALAILEFGVAVITCMATRRQSKRFLPVDPRSNHHEDRYWFGAGVFAEGGWTTIRSHLEMRGWSPTHIEQIHAQMRQGWPLSIAVRQVAMRMGTCPMHSKSLG